MVAPVSRLLLFAAALAVGCGSSDAPKGPTGTLKGKLQFAGSSLPPKSAVIFQHLESGSLYTALTSEDGTFEVTAPARAMPLGKYDVTVQPAIVVPVDDQKAAELALDGPPKGSPAPAPSLADFPNRYRNAHESNLSVDIVAGANETSFDLKK